MGTATVPRTLPTLVAAQAAAFLEWKMSNPWDVRPWAEQGDKSENDVFVAVGKALSHWELAEQAIAGLFTLLTVGSYHAPRVPALRAYSSVISSANRIQMVSAALDSWLREWQDCPVGGNAVTVLQECRGWAGRRNDVAHGLVDRFIDEFQKGWFLVPGLYSRKGRSPLGKMDYRYNASIVNGFSEEFLELHNRLNEVTSMMGEWHRIAASERVKEDKT
jgi:hypothetical protein